MCGIAGYVSYEKPETVVGNCAEFLKAVQERGRDAVGIAVVGWDNIVRQYKWYGSELPPTIMVNQRFMSVNMRAAPTSISEGKVSDSTDFLQPYVSLSDGRWKSEKKARIYSHNGTVANDREFNKKFELTVANDTQKKVDCPIDSVVMMNWSPDEVYARIRLGTQDKQNGLIGSFSMAMLDAESGTLTLLKNYMPLYVLVDFKNKRIWWSNWVHAFSKLNLGHYEYKIVDIPAYSAISLSTNNFYEALVSLENPYSLRTPQEDKALVVCSGGLDSTTVASIAVDKYGAKNTTLLHYQYGCKAQDKEKDRIYKIAVKLGCSVKVVDISSVFENMKSPILGKGGDIQQGDTGIEFAHEWVPARNLIMMSVAIGVAESDGFTVVMLGSNLTEQAAYPDNSLDFTDKLNALAPYAVQNGKNIRIETPVVNLMKNELIKVGMKLKTPYELTWSCYHDGEKSCGKCGPCTMRKLAFEMNGLEDPIEYE